MTMRVFSGVFIALVSPCFHALAEGEPPALKVPPVADRPIGQQNIATEAKGEPAPAKAPVASPTASPEEKPSPEAAQGEKDAGAPADAPAPDAIVPEPFPVSRYEPLWKNSPFQIESIAPPQQSEGLAQRFVLGGILRESGEPVIWVRERATQQSYKVSRKATNNLGLSLVEVDESMAKQSEASATVRLGNEQGVIKFDSASAGVIPGAGMAPPPMARPAGPVPLRAPQMANSAPVPGQPAPNTTTYNVQPNTAKPAMPQPGVVPPVPGPAVPGQVQAPGQEQMPPPRVIRRRAIVPAAPSTP